MSTAGWVVGGVAVGAVLFLAFSGKKKSAPSKPVPPLVCPAGQVRNAAGECVPVSGEPGLPECPKGQVRNAAGECVTVCPQGQSWSGSLQVCVPDECPTGKVWDETQQQCVPELPETLSADQAALLEGSAMWTVDPVLVGEVIKQVAAGGRATVGLDAWATELATMSDPEKAYYEAALANLDPMWKVRAAGWLAKQGRNQAAANMLALSVVQANPPQAEKVKAVIEAAELGAKEAYGGNVLGFAVATEELRAFMLTDTSAVKDSYEYLTGAGGYGMPLVAQTNGLLKYFNELNTLSQSVRSAINQKIATGDGPGLAVLGAVLVNFPQTRAQLDFLSKLTVGTDMKPLVPTIRDLAENGA